MSPEQIEAKPLDPRTDIFSFGVMLYEMATGERPFNGDSSPALMLSILKDHPTPIGARRFDVPPEVCRLIERCLEKHPPSRIQTATEILSELRAQRHAWESRVAWASKPVGGGVQSAERKASIAGAVRKHERGQGERILRRRTRKSDQRARAKPGLQVAGRTSSFVFRGKDIELTKSAGGSTWSTCSKEVQAGNRVRVTVQLIKVADGFHLCRALRP
jgi:serine/threonine protein kinase